jgi:hypothetical protein
LLFDHRLPTPIRYLIAVSIMLVCAALQAGLQAQAGFTGFFLLLPGIFLSGLLLDRGSGLLAAAMEAMESTARRIQVMAEVYDHLSPKEGSRLVDMRRFLSEIVEKVFQSLSADGPVAFQVICDDCYLSNQEGLAIGIIANELVTNSNMRVLTEDQVKSWSS